MVAEDSGVWCNRVSLNGARRGGAGYGNYEYQVYCERSAYRLYYSKHSGYNTIGFRCVKGVPRGSSMVTRAQYTRSAGWRNTDYGRRFAVDRVGFRLNGVRRGTRINDANSTVEDRCAWRSSAVLDRVHPSIGFRCEWCV